MEGGNHSFLYLVGIVILLILIPAAAIASLIPIGLLSRGLNYPTGPGEGGGAYETTAYFGKGYMFDSDIVTCEEIKKAIDNISEFAVFRQDNIPGGEDLALAFCHAGQRHHLNPIYILSHARLETGATLSPIARDKKNLFGYGARDECPYECAMSFRTYEEGVNFVMGKIKKNYLAPGGSYYMYEEIIPPDKKAKAEAIKKYNNISRIEKETLEAMNIYYASDARWAVKIKSYMKKTYDFLGKPTF